MSSAQLYDTIGAPYTVTRRTEPRIAARIWATLGDARTVLNVGAGTGSYEPLTATSPRWNRQQSCGRSAPQAQRAQLFADQAQFRPSVASVADRHLGDR